MKSFEFSLSSVKHSILHFEALNFISNKNVNNEDEGHKTLLNITRKSRQQTKNLTAVERFFLSVTPPFFLLNV
jgi:hypothetical protein